MLESIANLKPYPYKSGLEPKKRAACNIVLCLLTSLCLGVVRYLEDMIYIEYQIVKPALLEFFQAFILAIIFIPYLIYVHGTVNVKYMIKTRAWFTLVFISLELASYFSFAESRGYNNYLALSLTQGFMFLFIFGLSFYILKARYTILHYAAFLAGGICVGLLVAGNESVGHKFPLPADSTSLAVGPILSIVSVIFYATSYVFLEMGMRQFYIEELLALFGLFGIGSNLFYMALINPWEYFDKWQLESAGAFVVIIIFKVLGFICMFFLLKTSSAGMIAFPYVTLEFFYAIAAKLSGITKTQKEVSVFHFIGMAFGLAGIILYNIKSVTYIEDRTHLVHFFKRPYIPYDDEPVNIKGHDYSSVSTEPLEDLDNNSNSLYNQHTSNYNENEINNLKIDGIYHHHNSSSVSSNYTPPPNIQISNKIHAENRPQMPASQFRPSSPSFNYGGHAGNAQHSSQTEEYRSYKQTYNHVETVKATTETISSRTFQQTSEYDYSHSNSIEIPKDTLKQRNLAQAHQHLFGNGY